MSRRNARPKQIEFETLTAVARPRTGKRMVGRYLRDDGRSYWQGRWKSKVRDDRASITVGWATREEACALLATKVATGALDPASATSAAPESATTIRDLMDSWFAAQERRVRRPGESRSAGLSPKTVDAYDKCRRHLNAWLGELRPDQVTTSTVEGYIRDRQVNDKRPGSIRTVEREVAALGRAWRWGVKQKLMLTRDFPSVKISIDSNVFTANHHTPQPAEVRLVIAELDGEVQLLVRLLVATGARVSEGCSVTAGDLDLTHGTLALNGKTGRRHFPLAAGGDQELYGLLAERVQTSLPLAPLFHFGVRHPAEQVRAKLRRACRRAGVQTFTPHGIRRMVVTQMVQGGVDVKHAAELTGHNVLVMLERYAQVRKESLADAVRKAGLGMSTKPVGEAGK